LEEDEDDHAHEGHERCDRPVLPMATARFSPRLFDQRLDERFDLFALERFTLANLCAGEGGRGGAEMLMRATGSRLS
jgi:hypothetical protein